MKRRLYFLQAFILGIAVLSIHAPTASAQASTSYQLESSASSFQPSSTIPVKLSIQSGVDFAGASVEVTGSNAVYNSFVSAGNSAFLLVDYHENVDELAVICQQNRCPAGTYDIGTFYFDGPGSGSGTISATPVDTLSPGFEQLDASGADFPFRITANAPPAETTTAPESSVTIPSSNAVGDNGTIPSQTVSESAKTDQENQARESIAANESSRLIASEGDDSRTNEDDQSQVGLILGLSIAAVTVIIITGVIAYRAGQNKLIGY